jgi:hypothetical protein
VALRFRVGITGGSVATADPVTLFGGLVKAGVVRSECCLTVVSELLSGRGARISGVQSQTEANLIREL